MRRPRPPRNDRRTDDPARLARASPLALGDDLAVLRAQFDLANVSASSIDLFRNQGRALKAAARTARRNVAASMDANGRRRGIAVRLEHADPSCN
jgi:hypothetical protein